MNEFVNWLHKKVDQVGNDIHNDVVNPVQRDVIKPAVQAAQPVIHAAQPVFHQAAVLAQKPYLDAPKVVNFAENDVYKPAKNAFDSGINTVAHPANALDDAMNVLKATPHLLNQDVVHPILRSPQNFINDVSDPISNAANKSAFGRGVTDVGLGAYRGGLGIAQGVSGLDNLAARHNVLNHFVPFGSEIDKGIVHVTNAIDPALNRSAINADKTQAGGAGIKYNKGLYIGGQAAANVLPFATGAGEAAEGAKAADLADEAVQGADAVKGASLFDKADQAVEDATKGLSERGTVGRIAANTIRGAASPKNALMNAAWQGLNAGQQASKGQKVSPLSELENFGAFQVGAPLVGNVLKEGYLATKPYLDVAAKTAEKSIQEHLAGALEAFHSRPALNEIGAVGKDVNDIPEGEVVNTHVPVKKVNLGRTNPTTVEAAKKAFGLDVSDYNHTLDNYAVSHAMQDPSITKNDISNIPQIISDPDHIYNGGKTKQGLDSLVYHKELDGHNYYVEEARTGKNELAMKTLNKTKSPLQRSDAVYTAPDLTPVRSEQDSNNTVLNKQENVKGAKKIVTTVNKASNTAPAPSQNVPKPISRASGAVSDKGQPSQSHPSKEQPPLQQKSQSTSRQPDIDDQIHENQQPSKTVAQKQEPQTQVQNNAQSNLSQADNTRKPLVFVPKGRLDADPELQSLYDTAQKAQTLSPYEQFKADDAIKQHMSLRNASAEKAGLDTLKSGGTRDEAIKAYQKEAPGASEKMAKYRLTQAAKQAKQSLNVNEHAVNPELQSITNDKVAPGDYKEAERRYRAVKNLADYYQKATLKDVKKLDPEDKSNLIDYAQGTKDVSKAHNPEQVSKAIATFRKGANAMHAMDTNWAGGNTAFIKDFFPQYWADTAKNTELLQHQAQQDLEESMGPKAWRELSPDEKNQMLAEINQEKSLDDGNYSGFRSKSRIFANRQEGLQAGFEPKFNNPTEDIKRYFTGAKLNIAPEALIKGARDADILEPKINRSIDLPEDKTFNISQKGKKALGHLDVEPHGDVSKVAKVLRTADRVATVPIAPTLPVIHGGNQETNALFDAAWEMKGNKLTNMARIITKQFGITDADREAFYREGYHSPKWTSDTHPEATNALNKIGASIQQKNIFYKAMGRIEENIRIAISKAGKKQGMSVADISKVMDNALGDDKGVGQTAGATGIFVHYLLTNLRTLTRIGNKALHGNLYPAIGLGTGWALWEAGNKALQTITGNKNAKLYSPGAIGTLKDLIEAPGEIAQHELPSIVTSHVNPAILAVADQATGKNYYTGDQVAGVMGRLEDAGETALPFADEGISDVASGKDSKADAILNYLTGVDLPHVKGTDAAPNIPFLNTKGATKNTNAAYASEQDYYNTVDKVEQQYSAPKDAGTLSTIKNYLQDYKNSAGQTMELAPKEDMSRWESISGDSQALAGIQKIKLADSDPDPAWKLPVTGTGGKYVGKGGKVMSTSKLQVYAMYESMVNGSGDRAQLELLNPWLDDTFTAEQNWENNGISKGTIAAYSGQLPGGLTSKDLQYPTLSKEQNSLMSQMSKLDSIPAAKRTSLQIAQIDSLDSNSKLQAAYNALDTYNNNQRVAKGYAPINYGPNESPAVSEGIADYEANKAAGGSDSAWIDAHPTLWTQIENYYSASDKSENATAGAEAELEGPTGKASQDQLSSAYDLGQYDIVKTTNPNGTSTYSINPAEAYADSGSDYDDDDSIYAMNPLEAAAYFTSYAHKPKVGKASFPGYKAPKAVVKMPKPYLPAPKPVKLSKAFVPVKKVGVHKGRYIGIL